MLQVFLFGCYICFIHMFTSVFVMMLHMFCNDFSGVFASVSDSCFKCFRLMFQVFHLSSDACCKSFIWMFQQYIGCCPCCNVTHLPQPFVVAAGASCMRVGSRGVERCAATSGPRLTRVCSSRRHPDTGVRPNVRALVLPNMQPYTFLNSHKWGLGMECLLNAH
jgi:hypothetical protein